MDQRPRATTPFTFIAESFHASALFQNRKDAIHLDGGL
jgi:hypothetical protein